MFRKDLIEMLRGNPMTVSQIARLVDESPSRIADDLNHLLRSLKHTEYEVPADVVEDVESTGGMDEEGHRRRHEGTAR